MGGSCLVLLSALLFSLLLSGLLLFLRGTSPVDGIVTLFQGAFGTRWALEDPLEGTEKALDDLLLSCFAVLEVIPFDMRQLRSAVQRLDVGQLEVKKRGVSVDPDG